MSHDETKLRYFSQLYQMTRRWVISTRIKKNANDLRVCHTVSESFKIKQNVAFTRCCEWLRMKKKILGKCLQVKASETFKVTKLAFSPPFQRLGSNQRDFSFSLTTEEWWTFSELKFANIFLSDERCET